MSRAVVYGASLLVAFLLELCAFAALADWGVREGNSTPEKFVLGATMAIVPITLWGLFAAPHAPVSIPALTYAVKVLVFGGAVVALVGSGRRWLSVAFIVTLAADTCLVRLARPPMLSGWMAG